MTGLKALRESSDVVRLCLLLGPRNQPRLPPGEGWVLAASVPRRERLLLSMVFVLDESCSQLQKLLENSLGHWSHCYLQAGTATPSRVEVAL